MFLKMLTGTRADEDESYDNIIICMTVSTVLMVFISIMEALTYFLYNNKVQRLRFKRPNMPSYFAVPSKKRDYIRKQQDSMKNLVGNQSW